MKKTLIKYWVLKDGKFWFREMTSLGVRTTVKREQAERFPTKKAAMLSPAYAFSLMSFTPKAIR